MPVNVEHAVRRLDRWQQRSTAVAIPIAVIKKFFDDGADALGVQVAYWGFFSVFALLLVFASILGFVFQNNPSLQHQLLDSTLERMPVIGPQISGSIGTLTGSAVAIAVGVVGALWTGLGVTLAIGTALDRIWAVPGVAFGHLGTGVGEAGPAERDKIAADHDAGTIAMLRERLRSGHSVLAAAFGPDGPVAAGSCQAVGGVAEITGVGVLPTHRRRGLGAAVTALLAADALARGVETVFLSATDSVVARIYARIGFREIGTAMIAEPAGS